MKRAALCLMLIVSILFYLPVTTVLADQGQDDVKAEIQMLKNRLSELEAKVVAERSQPVVAGGHTGMESMPAVAVPSLVQGVGISGYVDSTYAYNFNETDTLANVARVFDRHSNGFNLNAAEVVVQKPVSPESRGGFRVDLFTGNDAEVIGSAGLGLGTDEFEVEQAYAEVLVPTSGLASWMNDIDIKAGRFVTMAGAEVIESKDNWNTSRGLLFGYTIPFTHTGVRSTYTFDNGWDLCLGLVDGWDVTDDTNNGKTIEAHLGLNSIALPYDSSITIAENYYGGPEQAGQDDNMRQVFDTVVIFKTPWKPLTLMYNMDYGIEENLIGDNTKADWWGQAVYARYDLNDKWALSVRGELLNDEDGVRVVAGTQAEYAEVTTTLEYRPWENTITRLEYRADHADKDLFTGDNQVNDNQTSISGELIYLF